MDANQDGNRTCPNAIGTCPDYGLEAYADWCEEKAAIIAVAYVALGYVAYLVTYAHLSEVL